MRNVSIMAIAFAFGFLAACGQKGPLVLPDAQKHKPTTANPATPLTGAPAPTPASTPAPTPSTPATGADAQSKDDKPPDAASKP